MPDCTLPWSSQSNATVTSVRFQPAAFGAGVSDATRTAGLVMSTLTVAVTGFEFPATSMQPFEVKSVPAVSVLTEPPPPAGTSLPDPGVGSSPHWKLTLVGVLFHP